MYDYRFSVQVVENFISEHRRGWAVLCNIYEAMNEDRAIHLFMVPGKSWYILKQAVKLAERLTDVKSFPGNKEFVKRNIEALKESLLTKNLPVHILKEH